MHPLRCHHLGIIIKQYHLLSDFGYDATQKVAGRHSCGEPPQVLMINGRDEVLTLSSGGCNTLNLLLHGAGHVVSVDCNPAQSALLELKATAIRFAPPQQSPCATHAHYVLHLAIAVHEDLRSMVCYAYTPLTQWRITYRAVVLLA